MTVFFKKAARTPFFSLNLPVKYPDFLLPIQPVQQLLSFFYLFIIQGQNSHDKAIKLILQYHVSYLSNYFYQDSLLSYKGLNNNILKKSTTLLLVLTIVLNSSCIVYQKTSVSLEQSIDQRNVKVITTQGKEVKFKKIILKDNLYYGVSDQYEVVDILLNPAAIRSIFLKDKVKSVILTSLFLAPNVAVLVFAIISSQN